MVQIELVPVSARVIISFFIGFSVGALARRTVKSAAIISFYFIAFLAYLNYVNILDIKFELLRKWVENMLEYIMSQSVPDPPSYVTDPASVFGGLIIGLIAGYYLG